MKKNILQRFYLCVFLLSSLGIIKAQNMSKYVTITVEQGQPVNFGLQAATADTPIKIISGDEDFDYTINNSWSNYQYAAPTTTITIYGDVIGLGCEENLTKITGLDVSHNPDLESLFCENNNISTLDVSQNSALKFFYCADNNLTSLDVSQNMALEILNCHGNNFTT